jgi:hypothetical protein
VDYRAAYRSLLEQLKHDLSTVETAEEADRFVVRAASQVRGEASVTQEFYSGEFLNMFKRSVATSGRVEMAECEQAVSDAKLEASFATVELQAQLEAITAAADQEAEHALWREREERQTACQAKIDAASKRLDVLTIRIDACKNLASALGHDYT